MYLHKTRSKRLIHIFQLQEFIILYILYIYIFLLKFIILIQWQIWYSDQFMAC